MFDPAGKERAKPGEVVACFFGFPSSSFDHLPQSGENDIYLKLQIAGEKIT
jgi:hypothetical protein